ncbi:MAG: autotransporter domain-containing protein [Thiobacillus sp.]
MHDIPWKARHLAHVLVFAMLSGVSHARSVSIVPAESLAWGVSANGQVVVGQLNGLLGNEAFLWTSLTGMVRLGVLPGGSSSYAYATSGNGQAVVGASENALFNNEAFLWTMTGGIQGLGFLPGGVTSQASAVNSSGSVIVGHGDNALGQTEAFRYDSNGMAGLGFLAGGIGSQATGVSGDGAVIAGWGGNVNGQTEAIRWEQGAAYGLGLFPSGSFSEAHGISADGTAIVGFGDNVTGLVEAALWKNNTLTGLGFLTGGVSSQAFAVNTDGSVVVGKADDAFGNNLAFRWDTGNGMQSVETWLLAAGANTQGWQLHEASGVNADGSVVVGQGTDPFGATRAYLARVSAGGETGLIDPAVWIGTLGGARAGFHSAQSQQAQSMDGAHHRTLLSYDANGFKHGLWVSGEAATRSAGEGGHAYLSEIGVFTDAIPSLRIGLATAYDRARQQLEFNGSSRLEGNYWLLEAGWRPTGKNWQTSLTLSSGRWDVAIRRAYANGGGTDVSVGEAPVRGSSMRLRLDFPSAWSWGETKASPYLAYAETRTRMAAYVEQGGAFPASFNTQKDTLRDGRIGLRLSHDLSSTLAVHGQFEWLHRFDRQGAPLSGSEASGLLPFAFSGEAVDRDWLTAGLDIDWEISRTLMIVGALVGSLSADEQAATLSVSLRYAF